ncbi:MAG: lysoplasmalogenase [Saprospiraceae bacterium]
MDVGRPDFLYGWGYTIDVCGTWPRLPVFFLLGLGSFLIAQLSYAAAFRRLASGAKGLLNTQPWWVLPFVGYLLWMLTTLWVSIPVDMRLPVAVYAIAIVWMALSALNLKGLVQNAIFQGLMAGVLLFVLSDSLIAWNKFHSTIPYARQWIMVTYLLAQWLIATRAASISVDK